MYPRRGLFNFFRKLAKLTKRPVGLSEIESSLRPPSGALLTPACHRFPASPVVSTLSGVQGSRTGFEILSPLLILVLSAVSKVRNPW